MALLLPYILNIVHIKYHISATLEISSDLKSGPQVEMRSKPSLGLSIRSRTASGLVAVKLEFYTSQVLHHIECNPAARDDRRLLQGSTNDASLVDV